MKLKAITSRTNAGFKLLQDIIADARARREHRASWIEGERLCQAYLQSDMPSAVAVIAVKASALAHGVEDALTAITAIPDLSTHRDRLGEVWLIDDKLFSLISPVETSIGWGLMIPIAPSEIDSPRADGPVRGTPLDTSTQPGDVLVLDRIQDPGNLGTMLRSAAAAGVQRAWCTPGTTDPWSPKALRSAMGAHFVMSITSNVSDAQVIELAHSQQLHLLAAARDIGAVSLFSKACTLDQPCAWIFGNEANGVSEMLLAQSQAIAIPQSEAVESLNVAAAASVCLFEMRRRRACS